MMLRTLGGVLAAAFCGAALLGAPAQAATVNKKAATVLRIAKELNIQTYYERSHLADGRTINYLAFEI